MPILVFFFFLLLLLFWYLTGIMEFFLKKNPKEIHQFLHRLTLAATSITRTSPALLCRAWILILIMPVISGVTCTLHLLVLIYSFLSILLCCSACNPAESDWSLRFFSAVDFKYSQCILLGRVILSSLSASD
jgi:hypothetical protein